MTINELRDAYLKFFAKNDHVVVDGIPLNAAPASSGLLFVNSGMVAFIPNFKGEEQRPYVRAASSQPSLRLHGKHNDYEQIGRTRRHHTFFEMLGNFSLGDYFKKDAISMAWKFLTEDLKLDKNMLWVSVHHSDNEAAELWTKVTDLDPARIVRLGDDTNLWAMGETGPNGYSSEIFYYMGETPNEQSEADFMKDNGDYLEIWNLVFMQFNRKLDGTQENLPKPCIDTGMGLERIASVVQGVRSNYDTDYFKTLIKKVQTFSGAKYVGKDYELTPDKQDEQYDLDVAMRVIADHARAIAFLIADGVVPDSEGPGYVLRRLIRRSIRFGQVLGIEKPFLSEITNEVVEAMGDAFPKLTKSRKDIQNTVSQEEARFQTTLHSGLKLLERNLAGVSKGGSLSGQVAFELYDTFGFPVDLTEEILNARGLTLDRAGFDSALEEQRTRSRGARKTNDQLDFSSFNGTAPTNFVGFDQNTSNAKILRAEISGDTLMILCDQTPFYGEKGGQVGDQGILEITGKTFQIRDTQVLPGGQIIHVIDLIHPVKIDDFENKQVTLSINTARRQKICEHHSGTHLLNYALTAVLGSGVQQRGSLVAPDRLRFDFSHQSPISTEELSEIENIVRHLIDQNEQVVTKEMPIKQAMETGAKAFFAEKYGELVRVVKMGSSVELCGGTHVQNTGDVNLFVIISEGGIASGVRRIEALCGVAARTYLEDRLMLVRQASKELRCPETELLVGVQKLREDHASLGKELARVHAVIEKQEVERILSDSASRPDSLRSIIVANVETGRKEGLNDISKTVLSRVKKETVLVLANAGSGQLQVSVSKGLSAEIDAKKLVQGLMQKFSCGKGGGRPESATINNLQPQELKLILQEINAQFVK